MTKEQKLQQILKQLQDDSNLFKILRMVCSDSILKLDDETVNKIYLLLNPEV